MKNKNSGEKFSRNAGGKEYAHGGNPKDLGDLKGNQVVPGRHEVNLVPGDTNQFDQHTGVAPSGKGE